jgi:hypothetical protein
MGDASHATLHQVAIDAFLAFALVGWPSWLPRSLGALERDAARRRILQVLSWCGAVGPQHQLRLRAEPRPVRDRLRRSHRLAVLRLETELTYEPRTE